SAVSHVLAVRDGVHERGRPARCARWARAAGFEHVSLDLIYGTPGESAADWRESLEAALEARPDHISAYALIVEQGTRLAARVRRGEIPMPDDEAMADAYLAADELLTGRGLGWYEISNWAASPQAQCRHNLLYWTGGDWWGVGPGAHSHVAGIRWWNVKHPAAYAARLRAGSSPGQAREVLTEQERRTEQVLLLTRVPAGSPRPGRPRRRRGGRRRWTGAATGPLRGPGGADQPGEAARRRCDPRPDRLRLASPGRAHPGRAHPGPTPGVVPLGLAGHREHEGEVAICAPRLGASRTLPARGTTPGAPGPRCGVTCGRRLGASRGIPGVARRGWPRGPHGPDARPGPARRPAPAGPR